MLARGCCWAVTLLVIVLQLLSVAVTTTRGNIQADDREASRIELCLEERLPPPPPSRAAGGRRKKRKFASLHLGIAVQETLGVLGPEDVLSVQALAECARIVESEVFVEGPSFNSTYLNLYFKHFLPDLYEKILEAARLGIRRKNWDQGQEAEEEEGWGPGSLHLPSIDTLGLRQVRLLSSARGGLGEYKRQLQAKQAEALKNAKFTLGGVKFSHTEAELADIRTEKLLKIKGHYEEQRATYNKHRFQDSSPQDGASVYTVLAILSDRSDHAEGNLLVENKKRDHPHHLHYHLVGETALEDIHPHLDIEDLLKKGGYFTEASPDLGSVVIIPSEYEWAWLHSTEGRHSMLLLEFWTYQDTYKKGSRPSIEEGVPVEDLDPFRSREL